MNSHTPFGIPPNAGHMLSLYSCLGQISLTTERRQRGLPGATKVQVRDWVKRKRFGDAHNNGWQAPSHKMQCQQRQMALHSLLWRPLFIPYIPFALHRFFNAATGNDDAALHSQLILMAFSHSLKQFAITLFTALLCHDVRVKLRRQWWWEEDGGETAELLASLARKQIEMASPIVARHTGRFSWSCRKNSNYQISLLANFQFWLDALALSRLIYIFYIPLNIYICCNSCNTN